METNSKKMSDCDSDTKTTSDDDYELNDSFCSDIEEDGETDNVEPKTPDPEHFEYECLNEEETDHFLNETAVGLSEHLPISPSSTKVLLQQNKWNAADVLEKFYNNASNHAVSERIEAATTAIASMSISSAPTMIQQNDESGENASSNGEPEIVTPSHTCPVCTDVQAVEKFHSLPCQHSFCQDCWTMHFSIQIKQGITTKIGCMEQQCKIRAPEDFVLNLLDEPTRERYQRFAFVEYVKSHPELRFCTGPNCKIIIRSTDISAKKATCNSCKSAFCFKCGSIYHAPMGCQMLREWLAKCEEHENAPKFKFTHKTCKYCPKCHVSIEKIGGCNLMICSNCGCYFCWLCTKSLESHVMGPFTCSRYNEIFNINHKTMHIHNEMLRKFLHYYNRWRSHSKSLQQEQQTLNILTARINEEVAKTRKPLSDWQYLFDGAALLANCRYTLQYTYPYAYYMETGPRKDLFEYQQSQLEAEIENLSWKIEHSETANRADFEKQMIIAEKRRTILLKDFFANDE
ncbi:potential E3 ubiquitin-protein ligase ariadne-2-like [Toxorhynchites rutilus septentrionalis]|uniref:potential E3 ubiquitin-protein ligase ariadne-2-like n=1 Tax=Toxorhynchites rutilus septentrionalis TaxID=329112 RepID=UPI00247AE203|nr:potential E3 ubiquitin-protein ligase ariadne-2-like [Toxorhynchites rutilus septentrionalis]